MKLSVYQRATTRTLPSLEKKYFNAMQSAILADAKEIGFKLDLSHMAMGVASETSELFECLEADIIDAINLGEEIGDGAWYGSNWANLLSILLDETKLFVCSASIYSSPEIDIVIFGGMLSDLGKRYLAYGSDFEKQEAKRLADFEAGKNKVFYTNAEILNNYWKALYNLSIQFDLEIENIMYNNIAKLLERYEVAFSEDEALMRDLEAERKALESNEQD